MGYSHEIKTAGEGDVITVAEMRQHMNFTEVDAEVDALLQGWINSQVEEFESLTGVSLRSTTYTYKLESWPEVILLRRSPVSEVTHVKYNQAADGVLTLLDAAYYKKDLSSTIGRIGLKSGYSWPELHEDTFLPIEIEYVAGYGAEGGPAFPDRIKTAIKLQVTAWFKNRSALAVVPVQELPRLFSPQQTISNHRIRRGDQD